MFERGFLITMGILWIAFGLYYFFQPEALAELAGVVATTPTAKTEIRAMYGGLEAAIGALAVTALVWPRLMEGVLVAMAVLTGGLGSTRLLGVLIDSSGSTYTAGGLAFELLSCGLALAALRRLQATRQEG